MTGKAKPKKHTAREIAMKVDAATTSRGGGKAGIVDRLGLDKGGHSKYVCPVCKATTPDVKTMQIHYEAKHPKLPFQQDQICDQHGNAQSDASASKERPGVRGSLKK